MLTLTTLWAVVAPFVKMAAILLIGHYLIVYLLRIADSGFKKANLDPSLSKFLHKAIDIVLHIFVILSALSAIGVSTTGLLAAMSAAAVAVGVALKDSLSNVAGGILLLIAPRFSTGDYIEAGGDGGVVLNVDLLHTLIRTADNRQVSIPNGVLVNSHITNYSREKHRRIELKFPIPYEADVEEAKRIALETIESHPLVLREPDVPFARVGGYQESSVTLTSRCWCATENYWTVYFDLMEQVRAELQAGGIRMPFNQLDIHIKEDVKS